MKNYFKYFLISTAIILLLGCRKEDMEFIQAPENEILAANSTIATLIQQIASNDGSNDNIIDNSNCFNIILPISVSANGKEITINTTSDYKIVEFIFDETDEDDDTLVISFPISIQLIDFEIAVVNNYNELNSYSITCKEENEKDDDIECLDFLYPLMASIYNTNTELIDTIVINSDNDLYSFIVNLNDSDFVTINFPVSVMLLDGTELIINNLTDLENTIEYYNNDCDEDDDYDYNDDDCLDCSMEQLTNVLTNCPGWTVDKLERYYYDYDTAYDGYTFNFFTDGTIAASYSNNTSYGTWTSSGSGNNLKVIINIPDLPYCNNDWVLHEISEYTNTKIDFRVGDIDRLRYENNCN